MMMQGCVRPIRFRSSMHYFFINPRSKPLKWMWVHTLLLCLLLTQPVVQNRSQSGKMQTWKWIFKPIFIIWRLIPMVRMINYNSRSIPDEKHFIYTITSCSKCKNFYYIVLCSKSFLKFFIMLVKVSSD